MAPQHPILIQQYPVVWRPPLFGWLKINTDGAARGRTGESSCGGVIRDFQGLVVKAFCENLGHSRTALEAEIRGFMRAIHFAVDQGLHFTHRIWLETDSMQIVKLVHSNSSDVPLSVRDDWIITLDVIKQLQCLVTHIYREGNSVADKLANFAIDSHCLCAFWDGAPDFVAEEAKLDALGFVRYRAKKISF